MRLTVSLDAESEKRMTNAITQASAKTLVDVLTVIVAIGVMLFLLNGEHHDT